MAKINPSDTELQELTAQQISEMTARLKNRRAEITKQLADSFRRGKTTETEVVLSENSREARAVARNLLRGASTKLPLETAARAREAELMIERDGIDIALRVLQKDELRNGAVAAVQWTEANLEQWKQLWRRALIARAQAQAAEQALLAMRTKAGSLGAELPLAVHVTRGFIVADNLFDEIDRAIQAAIQLGYVSSLDLSRAVETSKESRR